MIEAITKLFDMHRKPIEEKKTYILLPLDYNNHLSQGKSILINEKK